MRLLLLPQIEPGSRLGKTIYDESGRVLLSRGTELMPAYLETLRRLGYQALYLLDPATEDLPHHEPVSERTRQEAIGAVRDTFRRFCEGDRSMGQDWAGRRMLYNATTNLVNELLSNRDLNLQLAELRSVSTYTFQHSVNVCLVGVALGQRLGLPFGKLTDLAMGLMLHDLGKTAIPSEFVGLHEGMDAVLDESYRAHARRGFDILQQVASSLPSTSRIISLQHHERHDGTGFPKGLAGEDLHPYARIAAVANCYDNLLHDMVNGRPVAPFQAIEYFMAAGGSHFHPELVQEFVRLLVPFPVESMVRLSTGEEAIVIAVDRAMPMHPTVRVLTDPTGARRLKALELDLARNRSITIVQAR